jgi:hypothetical protein
MVTEANMKRLENNKGTHDAFVGNIDYNISDYWQKNMVSQVQKS